MNRKPDKVSMFIVALLLLGAVLMGWQEVIDSKLLPDDSPAPDFSVKTLAGGEVSLASLRGKVVLVDFWATWCPPCREEMPYLVKLAQEYEPKGVTLVAISNDDLDGQQEVVDGYVSRVIPSLRPFAAFGTPAVGAKFLVRSLPTLYVIDRNGQIVESQAGQASESQLRRWIEKALERPYAAAGTSGDAGSGF